VVVLLGESIEVLLVMDTGGGGSFGVCDKAGEEKEHQLASLRISFLTINFFKKSESIFFLCLDLDDDDSQV